MVASLILISNGSQANDDGSIWVMLTDTTVTVDTTAVLWALAFKGTDASLTQSGSLSAAGNTGAWSFG